jgi:hypothetical protein
VHFSPTTLHRLRRLSIPTALALAAFPCNSASAQAIVQIAAVPTSWVLQNYVRNQIVLYNTGS